jgi:FtsH-binding integral membrane protein
MDYDLQPAYAAREDERAVFIRLTYGHLAGAVLAFTALECALFQSGLADAIVRTVFVGSNISMLLLMVAFIGVGWLAQTWARSEVSIGVQYLGLGLYIVAEAFIFLPLLYIAIHYTDASVIPTAGILTLTLFLGLTLTVFVTGKDFSFLAPIICIGSFLALGVIIAGWLCGFNLGLFFSFAMVLLAAGAILYNTSNVLHYYRPNQYVAASLDLFASLALLFYYVLRILVASRR